MTTQPVYQQGATPVVPVKVKNNGFAVASLVLGLLWLYWLGSLLAVIFGHVGLSQIGNSQGTEQGRGFAIAGLVLGYVGLAIAALFVVIGVAG